MTRPRGLVRESRRGKYHDPVRPGRTPSVMFVECGRVIIVAERVTSAPDEDRCEKCRARRSDRRNRVDRMRRSPVA